MYPSNDHAMSPRRSGRVTETRSRGTGTARLREMSVSDAEALLARMWCRVEEHGIEAPHLRFVFRRHGKVRVQLSFSDPSHSALVLDGLEN